MHKQLIDWKAGLRRRQTAGSSPLGYARGRNDTRYVRMAKSDWRMAKSQKRMAKSEKAE